MECQFDQRVPRRNTQCVKWDGVLDVFGQENLLPMWVADMDFRAPEAAVRAVTARAAHGIYGYEKKPESLTEAVLNWLAARHNWAVDPTWLSHCPGVVSGLVLSLLALTEPGDRVVIQPPVYPPFFTIVEQNGRTVVENPLVWKDGQYRMNLSELEDIFRSGVKTMMLCSPHNPVGRVWSRGELLSLGELLRKYGVTVFSDEIWADLAFPAHRHIPLASLSPEIADQTLTFMAPSKTFNLAGLYMSNAIISNEELRSKFSAQLQRLSLGHVGIFGPVAAEASYREGGEWLDRLLTYLEDNVRFVTDELAKITPKIRVIQPEGTFVLWLDCRDLGIPWDDLNQFFVRRAGLAFNDGARFGPTGAGFQRMNIGCPRVLIQEAMERLSKTLRHL